MHKSMLVGRQVGRQVGRVHAPTYNQKKKWEASEGFKASHGSKGKDDGKTRSMHDKQDEQEVNTMMVRSSWPIGSSDNGGDGNDELQLTIMLQL